MTIAGREDGWEYPEFETNEAPWDAFYAAFGRLMQMSGLLEIELHKMFKSIIFDLTNAEASEMNWEILEALTGSLSASQVSSNIHLILRVVNYDKAFIDELTYVFQHVGNIRSFRNSIAHHAASSHSNTEFRVSDAETVKEGSQEELLIFTVDTMLNMAYDLNLARKYISLIESTFLTMDHKESAWKRLVDAERPKWHYNDADLKKDGPKHWSKVHLETKRRKKDR